MKFKMEKIFKISKIFRVLGVILLIASVSQYINAFNLPAGSKEGSVLGFNVNDVRLTDDNKSLNLDLSIDLSEVKMKSNVETVYTPMLINGEDTLRLESFTVEGRNRFYSHLRNDIKPGIQFYKSQLFNGPLPVRNLASLNISQSAPEVYTLQYSVPFETWMESSVFTVETVNRGCDNCLKEVNGEPVQWYPLAQSRKVTHAAFVPDFIYITPVAEAVKTREIAARAYIDFPVNKIEIYPDYRRNPSELAKIRATIDSIRNDKDITVTSLHISGTASPEGSYQNNVRLAKGRTEALKNYVQNLYKFPAGFITTSFEPVDWAGLKEFLMNGPVGPAYASISHVNLDEVLPSRENILNIVNGNVEPYQKNQNIKNNYPKEYQWLLQNVYPALRHSDYRIEFEIRTYTEAAEILEIMQSQPQKLSLAELFVAANSQPEGSELYNKAFEIAVTMYPNDETANLNAGVNAMKRNDFIRAERYLEKAGSTPEAEYARAMSAYMRGENEAAKTALTRLSANSDKSIASRASSALERIQEAEQPEELIFEIL